MMLQVLQSGPKSSTYAERSASHCLSPSLGEVTSKQTRSRPTFFNYLIENYLRLILLNLKFLMI